ncbi:hypothetical protein [Streptomyces sp. RKAG290]|uniref:hypothetical protein n=1 Tax=Streptomyces sp. RKAG290 TaxID=2888348 RepID=UPI0020339A1A|nr:hypothetical protein [Streptomyces sp. RKAG290]MCM2416244.1 hypothetical protein [Streptomyces sp. RKAG290]
MSEVAATAGVTASYARKVTEDLTANKSEQERVRTELTRLQDELLQLEVSEQVLVKMQDVLVGAGEPATEKAKAGKKASVPAARRGKSTAGQGKAAPKAKTSKAAGKAPTEKAAPAKAVGEATWVELATSYLSAQSEPKSAAEVSAALTHDHPERSVQAPVVRNALEQGVARGLLERAKQGRSVYYTPATATSPDEPAKSAQ